MAAFNLRRAASRLGPENWALAPTLDGSDQTWGSDTAGGCSGTKNRTRATALRHRPHLARLLAQKDSTCCRGFSLLLKPCRRSLVPGAASFMADRAHAICSSQQTEPHKYLSGGQGATLMCWKYGDSVRLAWSEVARRRFCWFLEGNIGSIPIRGRGLSLEKSSLETVPDGTTR